MSWGASDGEEHWYVVDGNVSIDGRIAVTGNVHLILMDDCLLSVEEGIRVASGDSLTIYGQNAGSGRLRARVQRDGSNAAVGGNSGESAGSITVHGGYVSARSESFEHEGSGAGAGIGGGADGDGGMVLITGGRVEAAGGETMMTPEDHDRSYGAGIGGGSNGDGGSVTITGGIVDAAARDMRGIGGGSNGEAGTVSITGGYFFQGDSLTNTVCNGVPVADGLSVLPVIVDETSYYSVTSHVGTLNVAGGVEGVDYKRENDTITILSGTPLVIEGDGSPTDERIVVDSAETALLIIKNVSICSAHSPFEILEGCKAELVLEGENYFDGIEDPGLCNDGSLTIAGDGSLRVRVRVNYANDTVCVDMDHGQLTVDSGSLTVLNLGGGAGISCGPDGAVTINGGSVEAHAGGHGAGIGGGNYASGGTITINGGEVSAYAGAWGAGIGGGSGTYGKGGSGGKITITGGKVYAKGGTNGGAGIGGAAGTNSAGGTGGEITITGGDVCAEATRGAGIGGGGLTYYEANPDACGAGGIITITGGVVTATSNVAAGIGGGGYNSSSDPSKVNGAPGGSITISGGTVTATSGREGVGIGAGISTASSGSFNTGDDGKAVIVADAISDQSHKSAWRGVVFEGEETGSLFGSTIIPNTDFVVPGGKTLVIEDGKTLTVASGILISIQGTVQGHLVLMPGARIQFGGGPIITVGAETVVDGGGPVSIPGGTGVHIGDGPEITMGSTGGTVGADGSVTVPSGGSVQIGGEQGPSTTIVLPGGGTLMPGNGVIKVPGGSTVQTGDGPTITISGEGGGTVDVDGGVSIPAGGSLSIGDGQGGDITITPPSGSTVKPGSEGTVLLPGGSTVQKGDGDSIVVPGAGGTLNPDTGEVTFNDFTVTFDSQGGSAVDSVDVQPGTLLARPSDPVRVGYRFTGWYRESSCETAWDFGADRVDDHITLFAGWNKISTGGSLPSRPTYPPQIDTPSVGGSVTVSPARPHQGETVVITPTPDDGYALDKIVVNDKDGKPVPVEQREDGTFAIVQPYGSATIEVTFKETAPLPLPFDDVLPGAWYEDAVRYVYERGLMTGTGDDSFSPDIVTDRGMVAVILWRVVGSPRVDEQPSFDDVDYEDYYGDAVRWTATEGVATGYEDGRFGPGDSITREQLAVMLYRFAKLEECDVNAVTDLMDFPDAEQVSDFAQEAMTWACARGIIRGVGGISLAPTSNASRAEVATMIMRFCELYPEVMQ